MKISDAAAASGCHLETIRYYERVGLMPPPARTASGYRAYRPAEVERLRFISRGRELGFSLEEIRSLLRLDDDSKMSCGDVDVIARTHLADIRQRIDELHRMATELERVIAECAGGERGHCTILNALREMGAASECTNARCRA
ncbi:MAG: helix-turn-helix domain-containing protein [Dokdonella sp.]|jgi:MerR family mercuric resistance operon transcriptional regulator|uniref:MerR family transcriptional regulator n=1 Tax=Dokdonella sp. TaxID=2291710 RepID=UPI0025C08772|nr:helix-turn-helix domain-containing protein [Dokdonella sp.]MBK8122246.1 helix-turn-helix domain-containing protein [Dokdonella sp.]